MFRVLVLILLYANTIFGNKNNYNYQCAQNNDQCNPSYQQPCCEIRSTCEKNKLHDLFTCKKQEYIGMFCTRNEDCDEILHSKCSEDNTCICRSNTIEVNFTICAPLLGEYCVNNEKCAPDNSICIHNECWCRANYSRLSNNQCKLKILGEPCTDDSKCEVVKFAKCSAYDNKCKCTANTTALNSTLCAPLLGGFCETNDECVVMNSICVDNKCKCKPNLHPESNARCKEVFMRMPCNRDSDCNKFINHSSCIKAKVCACIINHYPIDQTVCAPMYNQSCQDHEPCAINNSLCIDNKCRCKHNYVYQEFKCHPIYLEEPCVVHEDCHKIKFGICSKDKKCVCDERHTQFNETLCGPIIGGFCSKDDECKISNSQCINNRCECEAFYSPLYNKQCLPTLLGWNCEYDDDCRNLFSAKCSKNKKCICQSNHVPFNNTMCAPLLGEYCRNDEQCITNNSVCVNHACQCNHDFIEQSNNECIDDVFCEKNQHCERAPNAKCSEKRKKCFCNSSHVKLSEIACAPLLGEFCRYNDTCGTNKSTCINNQCSCQPNYVRDSNYKCLPLLLGLACRADHDCSKIKYAKCSDDNKCVCKSNYLQLTNNTCAALIGEYCVESSDCHPMYSRCFRRVCRCADGFVRQSNNRCLSSDLKKYCDNNNGCVHVMHSICSENNECVCIGNHIALNETTCSPLLNEPCLNNEGCATSNAVCVDNKCQCKRNYLPQSDNYCIPERLKGTCDCNLDCKAVKHAICSINNKCVCKENYVSINETTCELIKYHFCSAKEQCYTKSKYCRQNNDCDDSERRYCSENQTCICKPTYIELNEICQPIIGGYCSKNEDCLPDNTFCILNVCLCKYNFIARSSDECIPVSLGMSCESNADCDSIKNAKCSNGKICVCIENSISLNQFTCTVIIGGYCLNDGNCYIEHSCCVNNMCQCKPAYLSASDDQCVKTLSLPDCSVRSDCRDALHMDCSINNKCVCKPNHIAFINQSCAPVLGGFCWLEGQCVTEHSDCIDNSCTCKPGYVQVSDNLCVQPLDYRRR
ncbi:transmembrane cell adhesion receptor mua-3-like isoform X2 [Microplitis mediator]|uniref:transmembrane cell adhesion receptor mua-3-like isoform X2 n=1 Tax=Microplitis mediator TaxID=375433 RepID=UPI0025556B8A|nr:transmembrane cell adhesion receptor mua-3-like isoform X2 [Microplitis mediator]